MNWHACRFGETGHRLGVSPLSNQTGIRILCVGGGAYAGRNT